MKPDLKEVTALVRRHIIPRMEQALMPDGSEKKYPFLSDASEKNRFIAGITRAAFSYYRGESEIIPDWSGVVPNLDTICQSCGNLQGSKCELVEKLRALAVGFDTGED